MTLVGSLGLRVAKCAQPPSRCQIMWLCIKSVQTFEDCGDLGATEPLVAEECFVILGSPR